MPRGPRLSAPRANKHSAVADFRPFALAPKRAVTRPQSKGEIKRECALPLLPLGRRGRRGGRGGSDSGGGIGIGSGLTFYLSHSSSLQPGALARAGRLCARLVWAPFVHRALCKLDAKFNQLESLKMSPVRLSA